MPLPIGSFSVGINFSPYAFADNTQQEQKVREDEYEEELVVAHAKTVIDEWTVVVE